MRYNVGEKTPFIQVRFTPSEPRFGDLYLPWEDKLDSIQLVYLTCREHHKVHEHYAQEGAKPDCDGFIFVDDEVFTPDQMEAPVGHKTGVYYSQYPRATYGQLDGSMGRRVTNQGTEDFDNRYFQDALSYCENLMKGEYEFMHGNSSDRRREKESGVPYETPVENITCAKACRAFYEQLKLLIEEKTGKQMKVSNVTFTSTLDGITTTCPNLFDCELV